LHFSPVELHTQAGNKAAGCGDNNDTSSAARSAAKEKCKFSEKLKSFLHDDGAKLQLRTTAKQINTKTISQVAKTTEKNRKVITSFPDRIELTS
jgi:hypothetical protein